MPREELGAVSCCTGARCLTVARGCGDKVTDDRVYFLGLRSGGLCFLRSVVPDECPGFPVPRCPVAHLTAALRSLCAVTRPDSSTTVAAGERENEPQPAENTGQKQDLHSDGNRHDLGGVTRTSTATIDRETDHVPGNRWDMWGLISCRPEEGATW